METYRLDGTSRDAISMSSSIVYCVFYVASAEMLGEMIEGREDAKGGMGC